MGGVLTSFCEEEIILIPLSFEMVAGVGSGNQSRSKAGRAKRGNQSKVGIQRHQGTVLRAQWTESSYPSESVSLTL